LSNDAPPTSTHNGLGLTHQIPLPTFIPNHVLPCLYLSVESHALDPVASSAFSPSPAAPLQRRDEVRRPTDLAKGFEHMGIPRLSHALGLGLLELGCTIVYLILARQCSAPSY